MKSLNKKAFEYKVNFYNRIVKMVRVKAYSASDNLKRKNVCAFGMRNNKEFIFNQ
jgi:hypothetical protein